MASYPSFDPSNLFRVDGMVAVITGGGTGIGLAMAAALASNGAKRVYILGRRYDVLLSAVKLYPDVFYPIQCDVTSHESLRAAVDAVTANSGYINLLIVNSGAGGPSFGWDPSKPLTEVWEKLFPMDDAAGQELMDGMNETFNVNTTAAFFTMAAFLDLLEKGNKHAVGHIPPSEGEVVFGAPTQPDSDVPSIQSQIIVTGSIAGYSRSYLSSPAYVASKAAVVHLAKQASSGLARYGIRVNALAPGLFPSELAQRLIADRDPSKEPPDHPKFQPSRRFGGDEEMAGTVLYLASRAGSYCNGTILVMDGGRLSVMPSSY